MQRRVVRVSDKCMDLIAYSNFKSFSSNASDVNKMKKILQKAIREELTLKQKYCVYEYYYGEKSMKVIAEELNVNPSTVTRHIQNAKKRLRRVAKYY